MLVLLLSYIVIDAMTTLLVIVQFIGQSVGLMLYRHYHADELPPDRWTMPLYPLPCIVQIVIFFFIFITTDNWIIMGSDPILEGSVVVLWVGVVMFLLTQRVKQDWPFASDYDDCKKEDDIFYIASIKPEFGKKPIVSESSASSDGPDVVTG